MIDVAHLLSCVAKSTHKKIVGFSFSYKYLCQKNVAIVKIIWIKWKMSSDHMRVQSSYNNILLKRTCVKHESPSHKIIFIVYFIVTCALYTLVTHSFNNIPQCISYIIGQRCIESIYNFGAFKLLIYQKWVWKFLNLQYHFKNFYQFLRSEFNTQLLNIKFIGTKNNLFLYLSTIIIRLPTCLNKSTARTRRISQKQRNKFF